MIVCPNCNATLDTHCGKNTPEKIRKIKEQKQLNIEKSFISKRTIGRPPLKQLQEEIKLLGLEGTGRKYGVTGNSIKNGLKLMKNMDIKNFKHH